MTTKWIQFEVTPDSEDAFRTELGRLQDLSKTELGCLHYAAFESAEPRLFTVLESWQDDDAFEAHRAAPHLAEFKQNCSAMIVNKSALSLEPLGVRKGA